MDQLIIGTDHNSRVVNLIGKTREPHIQIVHANGGEKLPVPFVLTKAGPVFGLPAVIDYLQHRITAPLLLDVDPMRRGLQMTIFYRLLGHYAHKVLLGDLAAAKHFVSEVTESLNYEQFYTGKDFSICDTALYALLEHIEFVHNHSSLMTERYKLRCDAYLRELNDSNTREHHDLDDDL